MEGLSQGGLTIQNTRNFTKTLAHKRIFFCELRIFEEEVVREIRGAKKQEATRAWKDLNKIFH